MKVASGEPTFGLILVGPDVLRNRREGVVPLLRRTGPQDRESTRTIRPSDFMAPGFNPDGLTDILTVECSLH